MLADVFGRFAPRAASACDAARGAGQAAAGSPTAA
jgi:hypothetical protein